MNLSDNSNYRGIALSAIFAKIFDHIVLSRYHGKHISLHLICNLGLRKSAPLIFGR